MPPSADWFSAQGDEHPALASKSPRALEKLRAAVLPRLAELGLADNNEGYWSVRLEGGLHVCARIETYRPSVELTVHFPRAGGGIGKRHDDARLRIVLLTDGAWAEKIARALADAAEEAKGLRPPRCPLCDSPMVLRTAQRGPHEGEDFHGCSRFPDCRGMRAPWGTSSPDQADDGDDTGFLCPDCGSEMRVRYAKKGATAGQRFYGCASFPTCDRVVDTEEEATALRLMGDTIAPEKDDDWLGGLAAKPL